MKGHVIDPEAIQAINAIQDGTVKPTFRALG
jgi:hypothetical protein